MLKKLKSKSIKAALLRLFGFTLLGIALFIALGREYAQALISPVALTPETNLHENVGKYVTMDVEGIYYAYTYTYTMENGHESIISDEYMVLAPDQETVMGICIRYEDDKYFGDLLEELYYYDGPLENAPSFKVGGTLVEMDYDSARYFDEAMTEMGMDTAYGHHYLINVNKVGSETTLTSMLVFFASIASVLIGLLYLVLAFAGFGQRKVRKHCAAQGDATLAMERMEQAFADAFDAKHAYFTPEFILFQKGITTIVKPSQEILWAFQRTHKRNGISVSYDLVLGTVKKKQITVSMKESNVQLSLAYIENTYSWVALGYNSNFATMFRKDPQNLRNFAASQRQAYAEPVITPEAPATPSAEGPNYTNPQNTAPTTEAPENTTPPENPEG